jgi:hypothetical protein
MLTSTARDCVTADTNIYISGFEFGGEPLRFLELARM